MYGPLTTVTTLPLTDASLSCAPAEPEEVIPAILYVQTSPAVAPAPLVNVLVAAVQTLVAIAAVVGGVTYDEVASLLETAASILPVITDVKPTSKSDASTSCPT